MKHLILITALALTGCVLPTQPPPQVMFNMDCEHMYGKQGNSCKLTAPASADVRIDGSTVIIDYQGVE